MEITIDKKIPGEVCAITPFVCEVVARYDCTKLKDIRFVWSKQGSHGLCLYPSRKNGMKGRITVYVSENEKRFITFVKAWTKVPIWDDKGNKTMVLGEALEEDKDVALGRVEIAIWIFGHEMYHFLRRTKQVPGQNTQNQADGFGLKLLREYRSRT